MNSKGADLLSQCVSRSLKRYFRDLNGEEPANLYSMVMHEIEKPLLEVVMQQAQSNQTRAAQMLGINRNRAAPRACQRTHTVVYV
jgi:Fis family transcriptional regulator